MGSVVFAHLPIRTTLDSLRITPNYSATPSPPFKEDRVALALGMRTCHTRGRQIIFLQ